MNAREAMQALLDGNTLHNKDGLFFTLCEEGIRTFSTYSSATWTLKLDNCEIAKEYNLTFEEALRAMLDGKVVMCECEPSHGYAYRFHNGTFEDSHAIDYFMKWEQCWMPPYKQCSRWKIISNDNDREVEE